MLPRRPVPPIAPAAARLETPKTDPIVETDKKIIEQVKTDADQLKADLTYLTTQIGPRLTGSPQLDRASHWTQEQFKSLGLENVRLESWSIANSWTRGPATGRIVSPGLHELTVAGSGWSPPTNGTVKGEVIGVDAEKPEELEKYKGKLGGKIVIVTRPREMEPPTNPILTPVGQSAIPLNHPKREGNFDNKAYMQMRTALTKMMTEEKALAMLSGSEKMFGLMNMSTASREYQPAAFPSAYLEREDYLQIWRLLDAGTPVQLELNVQSSFSGKPIEVYNTVAEIRGTEKPDEVVIVGAHLDSWDLGTGSTDNGTGSMAALEAARALAKLGLKHKRTIRFVLFTGEEEGLVGSKRYVEAHKNDLEKISGVLVHDTGTGRVLTLGLHDNYQDREIVDQVLAPLKELKLLEPSMVRTFGTDHASFDDAGVPGFFCIQNMAEYAKTHHSQSDTFDKVWQDDLNQGAQVLAAWAYNTAQLLEMLPRRPLPYQPTQAVAKTESAQPDPLAEMDAKLIAQVKTDEG